ncbi:MAG: DUF4388 domain-containing protein [Polyangiales bacterium]
MAEPSDLIVVEPNGQLSVSGRAYERRLRERSGKYQIALDLPGVLLLRSAPGERGRGTRPLMAGEIVNRMTVMEMIGILAQTNWRGDLHIVSPEGHRVMQVDQGALKYAGSDADGEQLGEVMVRSGALTRTQFDQIMASMRVDQRFGEACVESGAVDQQKLFEQLQRQAETIFFGALLAAEGTYAFVLPDEQTADPRPWTVHLAIQGLLMEGVQRIDEMALFRDKIPHSQMCPVKIADGHDKKIDDNGKKVLAICDGTKTIEEIARVTGLGEFLTTKAVYHLLQAKCVNLRSAPKIDPDQVRMLVGKFNDVLQDIFVAVATYGGLAQTRATLEAWIVGSGYAPYFGEGVDDFGAIDAEHVVAALGHIESDEPLEGLHQALHELAAFALFSATTTLPRDQELALARDVNARLKAIRID